MTDLFSAKSVILFDMDGVMIDSEPQHFRAWKRTFGDHGVDIDYDHYKACIGSTDKVLYQILRDCYGFEILEHPEVPGEYTKNRQEVEREEGIIPMPGVRETVRTLYERGYRMAVASSSPQVDIEHNMQELGITDCFAYLFSGRRAPHPKPAPDTFLMAAEAIGAKPEDCVVIEDSENGSRAARAAGMRCIGIRNPGSGDQNLEAADIIVNSLPELLQLLQGPGAD